MAQRNPTSALKREAGRGGRQQRAEPSAAAAEEAAAERSEIESNNTRLRLMAKEVSNVAPDKRSDSSVLSAPKNNSNRVSSSQPSVIVEPNKATSGIQGDENSHYGKQVSCITNISLDQERAANKHIAQNSSASKPVNAGNMQTKDTVSKSFVLGTQNCALSGNHTFVSEETDLQGKPAREGDSQLVSILRNTQETDLRGKPSREGDPHLVSILRNTQSNSPLTLVKTLQLDSQRLQDTEDSCSVVSSTAASVRTLKGRITVATAPTFRCSERAEKRKEFYYKLEQKHKALEAEKMQSEARMREEQEAALKEFRRSLVIKANPVPSFYHEGPPPKVELKKVPPTRAKSPKFTRRASYSDANPAETDEYDRACDRFLRHSLSTTTHVAKRLHSSPKVTKGRIFNTNSQSSKPLVAKATNETTKGVAVHT